MSKLISHIRKGNRTAMNTAVNALLPRMYALTASLLDSEADIAAVCKESFATLWSDIRNGAVTDRDETIAHAMKLATAASRRVLHAKDSKAFRIPSDRHFVLKEIPAYLPILDRPAALGAVRCLPPLHRVIAAATYIGGLNAEALAELLKLDQRTMGHAVEAQAVNLDNLLRHADEPALTCADDVLKALASLTLTPSEQVKAAVLDTVNSIAAPLEKKRRRKTWSTVGIVVASCVVILALCAGLLWDMTRPETEFTADEDADTAISDTMDEAEPADVAFSTDYTATHVAEIAIQNYGNVTVELDGNMAPETVKNFESLANSGFYDGLTFHRIMDGFMMQGGDPNGNGSGGSDVNVIGEFAANGYENTLTHTRGAISMARATDYDSGSSQFFIVHEDSTFLDGDYAAFGYVTDGMDIVDTICTTAEPIDDNGSIPRSAQPIITSVVVNPI